MKRIEVRLSLDVVAPLLDVIKAASDALCEALAVPTAPDEIDVDLRVAWRAELLAAQNREVGELLGLFDSEFFVSGVVAFDGANAELILRACAAVRLQVREQHLAHLPELALESGDLELTSLDETTRKAFMCYLFLATVQELIIEHLDDVILEG